MHSEGVKIWVLEMLCKRLQGISKRCPTPPSAAEGAVFQSARGFGPRSPLLDPPLVNGAQFKRKTAFVVFPMLKQGVSNPGFIHGLTQSTFCMGWTRAGLGLTWACHTRAHAGWAEGGQAQLQPKYLGLPTLLLGRARLGMPKQLIGLATAGACPSK